MDSCLQKIAQDRPTSDVLLKVQGIKRIVWCCTWERAETCDYLFVREHLSDHAWGNVNIVQENNVLPFLFLLQLDATSCAIIVSLYICCYSWLKRVLTLQTGQLISVGIICRALELQRQISKGNGEWGFNVRVSVWSSGSRQSSWVDVQLQWCFRNWISINTHRNPWWLPYVADFFHLKCQAYTELHTPPMSIK